MPSYNRVVLIGRLTRDPELRYTAGGLAITKFTIAVDRRFKNQQGERVTDFFDCSAFRQTAEFVQNYVGKGRLVCVDGRIEINQTTGQDGQKRYFTNIVCDAVETLDSARDAGEGAPAGGGAAMGGGTGMGAGAPMGGAQARNAAPADGGYDEGNGYFADEDAAPARPARQAAPQAQAPRPAPRPAAGYPEDDFDDSDPFADQ